MSGQDGFVDDLYATVLAGTGQESGGASGQGYICLEWPGLPIEAGDFANALTGENPGGSPAALEAFSTLVDEVPALSPLYTETGVSLESVYGMILMATVTGGGAVAQAFAGAKEKFESMLRGSVENALDMFHPSYAQPRTWADPAGAGGWVKVEVGGGAPPPPPPPPVLHTLPVGLTKATWRFSGETPPIVVRPKPEVMLQARPVASLSATTALRPAVMAGVATRVGTAPPIATAPPATIVKSVARMPTALQATRLSAATLRPAALPAPVAASAKSAMLKTVQPDVLKRLGTVAVLPKPPPIRAPVEQPAATSNLRATLQMMQIGIKRPWFDPLVMRLPGWSLEGIPSGFFSNGKPDSDPGLCPLVPTSVIAVRDVRITGSWTDGDRAAAGKAVASTTQSAFGPFTLAAGGRVQGRFDGSTLTIPGMQIIAWICSRMPMLPP
jgi:hypothetical protein